MTERIRSIKTHAKLYTLAPEIVLPVNPNSIPLKWDLYRLTQVLNIPTHSVKKRVSLYIPRNVTDSTFVKSRKRKHKPINRANVSRTVVYRLIRRDLAEIVTHPHTQPRIFGLRSEADLRALWYEICEESPYKSTILQHYQQTTDLDTVMLSKYWIERLAMKNTCPPELALGYCSVYDAFGHGPNCDIAIGDSNVTYDEHIRNTCLHDLRELTIPIHDYIWNLNKSLPFLRHIHKMYSIPVYRSWYAGRWRVVDGTCPDILDNMINGRPGSVVGNGPTRYRLTTSTNPDVFRLELLHCLAFSRQEPEANCLRDMFYGRYSEQGLSGLQKLFEQYDLYDHYPLLWPYTEVAKEYDSIISAVITTL